MVKAVLRSNRSSVLLTGKTDRPAELGTEAGAALGYSVIIQYASGAVMLGIALLTLWLLPAGSAIRQQSARTALSRADRLRPRPDPSLESALQAALAEFDKELALILRERDYAFPAGRGRPTRAPGPARVPPPRGPVPPPASGSD